MDALGIARQVMLVEDGQPGLNEGWQRAIVALGGGEQIVDGARDRASRQR